MRHLEPNSATWNSLNGPHEILSLVWDHSSLRRTRLYLLACLDFVSWHRASAIATDAIARAKDCIDSKTYCSKLKYMRQAIFRQLRCNSVADELFMHALWMMLHKYISLEMAHNAINVLCESAYIASGEDHRDSFSRSLVNLANEFFPCLDAETQAACSCLRSCGSIPDLRNIAKAIYQDNDFDQLPVLCDALKEIGISECVIDGHINVLDVHIKGCWIVDWILMLD